MDVNTNNNTAQSGAENSGQPPAVEQAAGTGQAEQLNAFQKFMQDLLGGNKDKSDAPGSEDKKAEEKNADKAADNNTAQTQDIAAIIAAERQKWEAEQQEKARLEKLPPEERAKAEQQTTEKRIADLEAQIVQRDLKDAAVASLTKDGFPVGLASILDYSSKGNMEKSLQTVTEVIKSSVTEIVNSRLRGPTPEGLGGAESPDAAAKAAIAANIRGGM